MENLEIFNWISIKKQLEEFLKSRLILIKDFSTGSDTKVYFLEFDSTLKLIVKIPSNPYKYGTKDVFLPIMLPTNQAQILKILEKVDIKCPKLIYLDQNGKFYAESFLEAFDLSNVMNEISEKELFDILFEIGVFLKKLHLIATRNFGDFEKATELKGRLDKWIYYFSDLGSVFLEKCSLVLNEIDIQKIKSLFEKNKGLIFFLNIWFKV